MKATEAHGRNWMVIRHLGLAPGRSDLGLGLAVEVSADAGGFETPAPVHLISYDLGEVIDTLEVGHGGELRVAAVAGGER